jgi:hypothetical protein
LPAVGDPAAVASYRHARDVIAEHGDPVMAPWLALTTDGMLLAAARETVVPDRPWPTGKAHAARHEPDPAFRTPTRRNSP